MIRLDRTRALLPAAAALALLGALPAGASAARACAPPAAGAEWERAAPEELGLDPAALQEALAHEATGAATVAVYRHGCLAASQPSAAARDRTYESWSTAKSVVSLAAGRAMTLGLLSPDDRVGSLVAEADRAHGALTLRQLLEMSSGLHWNLVRDYTQTRTEHRVNDALTLPFDHPPGTYFEYAQSTVALVAELVARAAGEDFQAFVQRELFTPIGIAPGSWSWLRENHGHTLAYMGLQLRPADDARLGELTLRRGRWNGRRLLSEAYVTTATTPSPSNPGYGWLWWVNAGERFVAPTVIGRDERARRLVESAPPDMFAALGRGDQLVMVVPSLDLVVTRSADVGTGNGSGEQALASTEGLQHEFVRRLMRAVVDRPVPDAGPYEAKGPVVPYSPDFGLRHSFTEAEHVAAARQTPPLPPRGPAVARAALIGGAAVHVAPLVLRVDRGDRATVAVACPPVGRSACTGAVWLTRSGERVGRSVPYRAPRGGRVSVRLALKGVRPGPAVLRASSTAAAGATTTRGDAVLRRG